MLNTSGLDLAKSPPLAVPLSFFLTAPALAGLAGLLLMLEADTALTSRWTPAALALAHLLLLGFLTPIMCGALLQLLAVLVGAPARISPRLALPMALGLGLGALLLAYGLYRLDQAALLSGALLAAGVLLLFILRVLQALLRSGLASPLRLPLVLAVLCLGVTLLLGLGLVAERQGWLGADLGLGLDLGKAWTDLHLSWGLVGWMGLLLLAIGGELIPMFYLAPSRRRWQKMLLAGLVAALLVLFSLALLHDPTGPLGRLLALGLGLLFAFSMIDGFIALLRRQRARKDPSLGFWWLGQASLLLAVMGWITQGPAPLLGVLLIVGAGLSFTTGTLFKILPFLSWYHLQTLKVRLRRKDVRLPSMHGFIGGRLPGLHLLLHGLALSLLVAAALWSSPITTRLGGLLLAASALLLWYQLAQAAWRYRAIKRQLHQPTPAQ
ncbi:MAG: hypothetical protein H7842_00295 [Gammaproteobacteria bacterium SHHR-1]|uniref:hypothetical protein n=1 Tax=Magnetovirga frankeli TaxID=947516 RepID=UPI001293766F|nr:hypothetical protein D5125_10365 [gamma proteobacterium SS-5]